MTCPVCLYNRPSRVHVVKENGIFINTYKCNKCKSRWTTREYIQVVTINTKKREVKTKQKYVLVIHNADFFKGTGQECADWLDIDIFAFHKAVNTTRQINKVTIIPEEEYLER